MAYGNPSSGGGSAYGNPGGNEDYFADAPESKGEERTMPKEGEDENQEQESGQTAVVPKYILAGKEFKPGDEMMVQIVSIQGDKVEIKYAPEKGHEEEGEHEEAPMPGEGAEPKGDGEMQSMMY